MTTWQIIRLAAELAIDLVRGKLDGPGKPSAPRVEGTPLPHTHVEHIRRSTHGHQAQLGVYSFWCRGPDDPHPLCPRCARPPV